MTLEAYPKNMQTGGGGGKGRREESARRRFAGIRNRNGRPSKCFKDSRGQRRMGRNERKDFEWQGEWV